MWVLQASLAEDVTTTWLYGIGYCEPGESDVSCTDAWLIYSASFYWAVMTITSIGYGDISANTTNYIELCVAPRPCPHPMSVSMMEAICVPSGRDACCLVESSLTRAPSTNAQVGSVHTNDAGRHVGTDNWLLRQRRSDPAGGAFRTPSTPSTALWRSSVTISIRSFPPPGLPRPQPPTSRECC